MQTFTGPSLEGTTIGFVGFGGIAQGAARRFTAFKPKRIVYTTSKPKPFDVHSKTFAPFVDDVLAAYQAAHGRLPMEVENVPDVATMAAEADVLVVAANYSPATHHIIDKTVLARMKNSAYLVNVARGPLVDTDALVHALRTDEIAGAGLDVIEGEPNVTPEHPILASDLASKVVLLPHVGSATTEARHKMADYATLNALAGLDLRTDTKEPGAFEAEVELSK